ncbi:hypothetical protein ACH47Z_43255 [Streptomyces sp. NPDC020192]|uniref:hypothetical protein n=1 Tax=Streptomyces sp. NPDC020192 TaxID=3365066 RepID=UPI0037B38537
MRGYLTHAFNSGGTNYLRMAYCLALSIKRTQSAVNRLSVVVPAGQPLPDAYREAFDHVITVSDERPPHVDPAWRVDTFTRFYDLTPYAQTVTLDADMLFFDDVSSWWDDLAARDIVGGTAVTFRGEPIQDNPLRTDLYAAGLPDLHNGFLYFRAGAKAETLFAAMQRNQQDWVQAATRHFGRPDVPFSSDCAFLIALRDTGLEDEAVSVVPGCPRFVHMKACLQGWPHVPPTAREWRDYVDHSFDDELRLTIGGVRITDPFHYHVRDFVTDDLLAAYESAAYDARPRRRTATW